MSMDADLEVAREAGGTLGDRLSRRYFVITLAVFVAVGLPAYLYLARSVEQQFVGNYSDFSINTAAHIFTQHLGTVEGGAYTEPLTGKALQAFRAEVQSQVETGELRKVKVWRPDGMLLYSTDGLGVGNIRALDHHLLEALAKGGFSEVEADEPEVAGEESSGRILEIYLPIRDAEGRITNIFELYYGLAPLNAAIASMRVTLLAFLVVLFGTVVGIAQFGGRLLVSRNRQLARLTTKLARLAETDGLTGIANHRHFHEQLAREIDASTRYGRRFSMIMVDLDFFKRINDTYGHQTGDVVLRETAAVMARSIRSVDLVARYGGEEFAILLPETSERDAVHVANGLRTAIHAIAVAAGGDRISVTASFGVAEFPSAARDAESLVSAADSALYVSKKNGRDRVCCFSALTSRSLDQEDVEHLFHRLRHASVFTIQALATAAVAKAGVAHDAASAINLARLAGSVLEMPESEREALVLATMAYDGGATAVPETAREKAETLTPEEIAAIWEHPEASEKILAAVADLERILKVVRHHNEHFDGSGRPDGLKGEEIPFASRVLHIIDAYSVSIAGRASSAAASPEQAVAELRKKAGTQFDPAIVERIASAILGNESEQALVA